MTRDLFRSICVVAVSLVAAAEVSAQEPGVDSIKDRATFLPSRKHIPLKGSVIGLLVHDGQPVLGTEGRSGPPDQMCFAMDGASYRWVYVPTFDTPMITNLQVPVGEKGEINIFPALNMASPKNVAGWGVTKPFALVQVQVNSGKGSPAGDSFVATDMKVLDGTKEFPLKVDDAVTLLRKRYAEHVKKTDQDIERALAEAGKKALGDRKATGPRERSDLMFLTWLSGPERMRVHFRTQISDGAYQFVEGGGAAPLELPPQPLPAQPLPAQPPGAQRKAPPPPPRFRAKTGVTFGVEFGMAYELAKDGTLVRTQILPIESFRRELQPVPGAVNPRQD